MTQMYDIYVGVCVCVCALESILLWQKPSCDECGKETKQHPEVFMDCFQGGGAECSPLYVPACIISPCITYVGQQASSTEGTYFYSPIGSTFLVCCARQLIRWADPPQFNWSHRTNHIFAVSSRVFLFNVTVHINMSSSLPAPFMQPNKYNVCLGLSNVLDSSCSTQQLYCFCTLCTTKLWDQNQILVLRRCDWVHRHFKPTRPQCRTCFLV